MSARIWWVAGCHSGLAGYIGGGDGVEFRRHHSTCRPGMWRVALTGWGQACHAVVDDFGSLVEVRS